MTSINFTFDKEYVKFSGRGYTISYSYIRVLVWCTRIPYEYSYDHIKKLYSNTIRIEYHLFLHFLSNEEMKMYQMVIYIRELYNNLWYNIILILYVTYESYDASFCSSICRCLFYSYGIHMWFIDLRSIVPKIMCDGITILYKQSQTNIKYTVF